MLAVLALGLSPLSDQGAIAAPESLHEGHPLVATSQAMLTADDMNILRQAEIPIALPTYIPEGFQVDYVEAFAPNPGPGSGHGYLITYRQPQLSGTEAACFEVEASTGGFGGPVPERSQTIDPPAFVQDASHPTYQIFWTETGDPEGPFPEPVLFSDWIEGDGAFYRISSRMTMRRYCNLLRPETAHQILESFRYVD
ncbi:MAG: hypothetical protein EA367_05440 [Leptolyngbya sp. DLM2.Bin15]|nr:MAG: hypothetical protein EA367_05440 [Leptolyngbya sp. DLM2.Bin15]